MRVRTNDLFTPLLVKLSRFRALSEADGELLLQFEMAPRRMIGPREDIISEGDIPTHVNVILNGWACRYKQLENGRRQIFAYFLPGDLSDLRIFALRKMDHSIGAIGPATIAEIPKDVIVSLTENGSRVADALWRSSFAAQAVEREWIVNIGQRNAVERVCHLLCELFVRLEMVGLTNGPSFDFPLTQSDLADSTGLSTVHVNRTLQELRRAQLLSLRGRTLTIHDWSRLKTLALFNPNYLHLDEMGSELDKDSV